MKGNKMIFISTKPFQKTCASPDNHFIDGRFFDIMCAAFGTEQPDPATCSAAYSN